MVEAGDALLAMEVLIATGLLYNDCLCWARNEVPNWFTNLSLEYFLCIFKPYTQTQLDTTR